MKTRTCMGWIFGVPRVTPPPTRKGFGEDDYACSRPRGHSAGPVFRFRDSCEGRVFGHRLRVVVSLSVLPFVAMPHGSVPDDEGSF